MENQKKIISNPRMINPDGMYASEARSEDFFSLRDYFAGLALQSIIMKENKPTLVKDYAKAAYILAEAMLAERENYPN